MCNDRITFELGDVTALNSIFEFEGTAPFSEELICFLDEWSKEIRSLAEASMRADIASFGFFIRRAHLLQLREAYAKHLKAVGRGVILHYAPANLPTLFAYSMITSLLAGNAVIVRLPSELENGTRQLIQTLKLVLGKHPDLSNRILLIQYPHDKEINDWLSEKVDGRIVWGGNRSIEEITSSPLKPGAIEILFPDRKSLAVFEAKAVCEMTEEGLRMLAHDCYNDTYLTDQNACASPSLIYWLGEQDEIVTAKEKFWQAFGELVETRYELQDQLAVRKLEAVMLLAAFIDGAELVTNSCGNLITRVQIDDPSTEIWKYISPGGFFLEAEGKGLNKLLKCLNEQCQTAVYCGKKPDLEQHLLRVVPVGHSLDFSFQWERKDLFVETLLPLPNGDF